MDSEFEGGKRRKKRLEIKAIVRTDKKGRYILIKGVKYRIGKDVSKTTLAKFITQKSLSHSKIRPVNAIELFSPGSDRELLDQKRLEITPTIHTDRKGKYILINGIKYRVGKDVSKSALTKFVAQKSLNHPKVKSTDTNGVFGIDPNRRRLDQDEKAIKINQLYEENSRLKDLASLRKDNAPVQDRALLNRFNGQFQYQEAEQKRKDLLESQAREKSQAERLKEAIIKEHGILGNELIANSRAKLQRIAGDLKKEVGIRSGNLSSMNKQELIEFILTHKRSSLPSQPPSPKNSKDEDLVEENPLHDNSAEEEEEKANESEEEVEPLVNTPPGGSAPKKFKPFPIPKKFKPLSREETQALINKRIDLDKRAIAQGFSPDDLFGLSNEDVEDILAGNGKGPSPDPGMSNVQIDKLLCKYPDYLGCISHDQVRSRILPHVKPRSRGGFIINTDPYNKPGEHWQAVYFDARPGGDAEIDFFDSYGDSIDAPLQKDIAQLAHKLHAGTYLKLKDNRVRYQDDKSSNCGWFASKFLIDRFRGKPFADASGWNDTRLGEAEIERFKKVNGGSYEFSYVPSFGGHIVDFRASYPPSVRKHFTDEPITSLMVCRKPLTSGTENLLRLVSLGGWDRAKREVGYNQMFHLYFVINGKIILERNHVVEMYPGGIEEGAECIPVSVPPGTTFGSLLERTAEAVGPSLQRYDSGSNNCQVFILQVAKANGFETEGLRRFVLQDAQAVLSKLPWVTRRLMNIATDLAHKADVLIHGKKRF